MSRKIDVRSAVEAINVALSCERTDDKTYTVIGKVTRLARILRGAGVCADARTIARLIDEMSYNPMGAAFAPLVQRGYTYLWVWDRAERVLSYDREEAEHALGPQGRRWRRGLRRDPHQDYCLMSRMTGYRRLAELLVRGPKKMWKRVAHRM